MKDSLKTFSIAAISAFVVIGVYSFRSMPEEQSMPKPVSYEYMQFSTVESVIPGGLGRSRILTTDNSGQMIEKELKNFYSFVGINFGNIANNDRAIVARLNDYAEDGWELYQVTTGTNEQTSNGSSSGGLFISRYMLRRSRRMN
jgi:hypothetical protein